MGVVLVVSTALHLLKAHRMSFPHCAAALRLLIAFCSWRSLIGTAALIAVLQIAGSNLVEAGPIVISGYLADTAGNDNPFEYVQLKATQSIDFSVTPYSVVWASNGTASTNGWVEGFASSTSFTYGFDLSSGTVAPGGVFYVGGSGKTIDGSGSTDISGQNWIRAINTSTTGGDGGLGNASTAAGGVMGNGATADGLAVFGGPISSLTATTIPVDALFYGTMVNTALPPTPPGGGYTVSDNDHYSSSAVFGNPSSPNNTFLFPDTPTNGYTQLTGTYDLANNTWDVPRTGSIITLSKTSSLSSIDSQITLAVPEPSAFALGGACLLSLLNVRWHKNLL